MTKSTGLCKCGIETCDADKYCDEENSLCLDVPKGDFFIFFFFQKKVLPLSYPEMGNIYD